MLGALTYTKYCDIWDCFYGEGAEMSKAFDPIIKQNLQRHKSKVGFDASVIWDDLLLLAAECLSNDIQA